MYDSNCYVALKAIYRPALFHIPLYPKSQYFVSEKFVNQKLKKLKNSMCFCTIFYRYFLYFGLIRSEIM